MELDVPRTGSADTRQKLLLAASRLFARNGLDGATTREIAREAGVNEVTLFRHFQSKDKLLAAVLQCTFDRSQEAVSSADEKQATTPCDLREHLRRYVDQYEALLRQNIALMRTLIGEIHRYEEHEMQVFKGIFTPLKLDLMATLQAARERGLIRAEVDPLIAADLLGGMIFMEVLRRTSPLAPPYSTAQYLEFSLDMFTRGIATEPGRPAKGESSPRP